MAKGAVSKEKITQTLLATFEGSFKYDKEIRIPIIEDGEQLQIKCTLTCAKTNVEPNGDIAIPGETSNSINFGSNEQKNEKVVVEPTQEEKDNVKRLVDILGL